MKNITRLLATTFIKVLDESNEVINWRSRSRRAVSESSNPNEDSLSVDLEVGKENIEDGFYLKCLVFYDNEWTQEFCTTGEDITTSGDTATVHCDCTIDG